MKRVELCGKCAAMLADGYQLRKVSGGVDNKVVCEQCRRRRYGGTYEMEKKSKSNAFA